MPRHLKAHLLGALMVMGLGLISRPVWAIDVPPLQGRVTDVAHVLQPGARAQLEAVLRAYELRTGRQFALLTVKSLDDEPIDMFGIRVAEAWKLGRKQNSKDFSDGLIVIVAVDAHRSRIEVGYGLEADITDVLASRVVHQVMAPAFRAHKYDEGIQKAFDILMRAADKSPIEGALPGADDDTGAQNTAEQVKLGFWLLLAIVILLLIGPRAGLDMLLLLLATSRGGSRSKDSNDRFSGGGGSFGGGGASGDW